MKSTNKYPRKFKIIRDENPRVRRKQLSELKRDPYTNSELRGFLRDLYDNDIKYNINTFYLKKTYGKHKLYKLLRNAISAGYLQRRIVLTPHNNHQGYRKDYYYILAETPVFRQNSSCSFIDKKYDLQCPHLQYTLKWDSKEIKEKEKKEKKKKPISVPKICQTPTLGDTPPNPPLFFFSTNQVRIRQDVYDSLIAEYTEPIVTMAIDRMNAYMADTGKYQKHECHGAKLRAWLAKDAVQYRAKLEKQKQQAERQQQEEIERQRYALYLEAQRQKELEKQRIKQQNALLIAKRAEEKRDIIQNYAQRYPQWIKQSKMDLVNGVYWYMGECRIIGDDIEEELENLIGSHILSSDHRQDDRERTERAIECDKNVDVVYNIKKQEMQIQIGHSVLNLIPSVLKCPQKNALKLGICNFRFKSQMNSLLKSYGQYPMGS